MPYFERDVDEGFSGGLTRWGPEIGIEIGDSLLGQLSETRSLTLAVLDDYESHNQQLARLGVAMFGEWVAVAAMVRVAHNEPPLLRSDLETFLPAAVEMLNTAFCPPPS